MVHKFVFHNDRILPMEQTRLSPGQAGVINGWGLFSTLRVYEGQPFAFERHWNRLATDAARIELPLQYSPQAVLRHMRELIRANAVASGCVRIYLIHNKVGIWHSDESMPAVDLLMYTSDLPIREGAARLALVPGGRYAAHALAGTKVTSWLNNAWIFEQAHRRGFDDALLLNEHGEVSECTAANVFCVHQGQVLTPPLESGCLPGVSRQILLEIAPDSGIAIKEARLSVEQIRSASEVFITSTTRQVQAVSAIEDASFSPAPGPVTIRLAELFTEYVKKEIARAQAAAQTPQPA